jgi:hypothetical protein
MASSFLKEAVKLKELYAEQKANTACSFHFIKVSSQEEEDEQLKKIESETEFANVIIVRTDLWNSTA